MGHCVPLSYLFALPQSCACPYTEDGTRFYDLKPGSGQTVGKDDQVTVHFDCMYKGIDVVSTRSARLLGGNRTVAEASRCCTPSGVVRLPE